MRAAVRTLVTLCVVALAVWAGYQLWQYYMLTPWTRDARVRADVVVIAPDVSGWVRELKARDNQQVKAGDLLMSIDRERFQAAFDQASAVTETRAQQLRLREREAARRTALGPEAISAELRENAQINAAIARGELHEAEAQLQVAKINLARSEVRAPRSGHITNLRLAEGNYVNTGQSVMALVDDSTFYIQAYFEETKLPRIRVGDTVKVWLMGAGEPMPGACGEHQPRHHRPQQQPGQPVAAGGGANLQLGAAGPTYTRKDSPGPGTGRGYPECRHDRERAGA